LKIDNKVLDYVQGKKLCFVVSIENMLINCDCCNTNINIYANQHINEKVLIINFKKKKKGIATFWVGVRFKNIVPQFYFY